MLRVWIKIKDNLNNTITKIYELQNTNVHENSMWGPNPRINNTYDDIFQLYNFYMMVPNKLTHKDCGQEWRNPKRGHATESLCWHWQQTLEYNVWASATVAVSVCIHHCITVYCCVAGSCSGGGAGVSHWDWAKLVLIELKVFSNKDKPRPKGGGPESPKLLKPFPEFWK